MRACLEDGAPQHSFASMCYMCCLTERVRGPTRDIKPCERSACGAIRFGPIWPPPFWPHSQLPADRCMGANAASGKRDVRAGPPLPPPPAPIEDPSVLDWALDALAIKTYDPLNTRNWLQRRGDATHAAYAPLLMDDVDATAVQENVRNEHVKNLVITEALSKALPPLIGGVAGATVAGPLSALTYATLEAQAQLIDYTYADTETTGAIFFPGEAIMIDAPTAAPHTGTMAPAPTAGPAPTAMTRAASDKMINDLIIRIQREAEISDLIAALAQDFQSGESKWDKQLQERAENTKEASDLATQLAQDKQSYAVLRAALQAAVAPVDGGAVDMPTLQTRLDALQMDIDRHDSTVAQVDELSESTSSDTLGNWRCDRRRRAAATVHTHARQTVTGVLQSSLDVDSIELGVANNRCLSAWLTAPLLAPRLRLTLWNTSDGAERTSALAVSEVDGWMWRPAIRNWCVNETATLTLAVGLSLVFAEHPAANAESVSMWRRRAFEPTNFTLHWVVGTRSDTVAEEFVLLEGVLQRAKANTQNLTSEMRKEYASRFKSLTSVNQPLVAPTPGSQVSATHQLTVELIVVIVTVTAVLLMSIK